MAQFIHKIIVIFILGSVGVLFSGCTSIEKKVMTNFEGEKPATEVAILHSNGYRFWIYDGEKDPSDELRLTEGSYMLGFLRTRPRSGGAAQCQLEAGKVYIFQETGRRYLPKKGAYAFLGECVLDPDFE